MLSRAAYEHIFITSGSDRADAYATLNHYIVKRAITCPPAKRHLRFAGGPMVGWLGSFMVLQGIRTSIAKEPYSFVIFQWGGVRTPCPLLWIRTLLFIHLCDKAIISWVRPYNFTIN